LIAEALFCAMASFIALRSMS